VDVVAVVRSSLEAGHTPDQVARILVEEHGVLPISAIKALRSGSNLTLLQAKEVIRRNVSPERWAAAESLWQMIAAESTSSEP
jgi:hypothetical protein